MFFRDCSRVASRLRSCPAESKVLRQTREPTPAAHAARSRQGENGRLQDLHEHSHVNPRGRCLSVCFEETSWVNSASARLSPDGVNEPFPPPPPTPKNKQARGWHVDTRWMRLAVRTFRRVNKHEDVRGTEQPKTKIYTKPTKPHKKHAAVPGEEPRPNNRRHQPHRAFRPHSTLPGCLGQQPLRTNTKPEKSAERRAPILPAQRS